MSTSSLILLTSLAVSISAQSDQIKISVEYVKGKSILATPSATIMPGEEAQVSVTRDHSLPDGRKLPSGIILDCKAELKDGKIIYSGLFTHREATSDSDEKAPPIQVFSTTEILFSGTAEPGKKITTTLTDKSQLNVTFTILDPGGRPKK